MRERCMDLLAESARVSAAKLKFFRLAFGAAGGFGDEVPSSEARAAIESIFEANQRLVIGWMVTEDRLDKRAAKILLNLALIAGEALPRGGQLDIGAERRSDIVEIVVRGEGPRVTMDAELRAALAGDLDEQRLSPRCAAAWMVRRMVENAGGDVMLAGAEEPALLFGVRLPLED